MVSSNTNPESNAPMEFGSSSEPLNDQDVRAIVRLLGQTVIAPGDLRAKRRYLISELAKLVGADVWVWVHGNVPTSSDHHPATVLDGGWASEEQRIAGFMSMESPEGMDLQRFFPVLQFKQLTFCRASVLTKEQWHATPFFKRHRDPIGLDDFMFSFYPLNTHGACSGVGMHRFSNRPPFTTRDAKVAHLVLSEIDWLHRDGVNIEAVSSVTHLSRRQRQVLLLLLSGDSVKQIAMKLEISDHTVRDYVKVLHEHFNVSSRGELLAKFLAGAADVC